MQDTYEADDLSTISGTLKVQMVEAKGLILANEANRKSQQKGARVDPLIEVTLMRASKDKPVTLVQKQLEPISNQREVVWSSGSAAQAAIVDLGSVHHSGLGKGEDVQVTKAKLQHAIRRPTTAA